MAGFNPVDRNSTLLTGKAAYATAISCNEEIAELYEPSAFHEIELKVDDNGLHRMDIYSPPRTLVNSIPLHGEVVPMGELSNFQLLKSNIRGNVLCVIHQTSKGPKHEFFIFKRRDEMQVWIDRLNETLFPCTKTFSRRSTEPTASITKSTEGNDTADTAFESCLYEAGRTCLDVTGDFSESNCESSSASSSSLLSSETVTCDSSSNSTIQLTPSDTIDDVLPLKAAEISKNKFMTDKCIKTPVEDVYVFKDEVEDCHLNEYVCARQRSIPNPGDEVNKDYMLLHSETNLCERTPATMTVFKADANSQQKRQRKLVHRVEENHPRDMLRQLLDEVGRGPITMIISLEEAVGLKFFEDRGKLWVKNCGRCEGIYAGDSLIKINGHEVCNVDVCRNIRDIFGDSEEIQITIERLPRADLQLITLLKNGEIPFTVEGTKIKAVYVDHDEGLFESAKRGNGYITHVNGDYVPFSSTTLEVTALLQDFKDEFLVILHQRDFSEMLE